MTENIQDSLFELEPKIEDVYTAYNRARERQVEHLSAGVPLSEETTALLSLYRSLLPPQAGDFSFQPRS